MFAAIFRAGRNASPGAAAVARAFASGPAASPKGPVSDEMLAKLGELVVFGHIRYGSSAGISLAALLSLTLIMGRKARSSRSRIPPNG